MNRYNNMNKGLIKFTTINSTINPTINSTIINNDESHTGVCGCGRLEKYMIGGVGGVGACNKYRRCKPRCKSPINERDQLAEIAMLMGEYHVCDHTENSYTVESVESLISAMKEAWEIINTIDTGEFHTRALGWKDKWEDFAVGWLMRK